DGAQGAGEGGEEVGGGGFVIPNVGTTAVAAAGMIVNAFEAVEFAIGGAEARGGDESGEIGAGGLLDDGGESGLAEGGGEAARRAIGEVPGEEEGEIGVAAGRDGAVKAKSADGADFGGFGAEFAIRGEIVPEEHGGIPPASLFPAAEVSDAIVGGMEGG